MPYYIMRVLSLNPRVNKVPSLLIHFMNMNQMEQGRMKMYASGLWQVFQPHLGQEQSLFFRF